MLWRLPGNPFRCFLERSQSICKTPRCSQEGGARRPESAPRRSQGDPPSICNKSDFIADAQRSSQDGPGGSPKGPKTIQEGSKTAQDGPKTAQEGPKRIFKDGQKILPGGPQEALQIAPRRSKGGGMRSEAEAGALSITAEKRQYGKKHAGPPESEHQAARVPRNSGPPKLLNV